MRRVSATFIGAMLLCGAAFAQGVGATLSQSEILVIDPGRLFAETLFGQRIENELKDEAGTLAADNRRLEQALRDEEKALTERREAMEPDAFRKAADEFDAKVQKIRREQAEKARALDSKRTNAEQRFLLTAQGVLIEVMNERGGKLLLNIRQTILRDQTIDITNDAVARIDAELGTGLEAELKAGEAPADDAETPEE